MEIPERIWHLMAKALNNEATSVETEELNLLLERDPSIQQQYELLTRIWQEKGQGLDDEGNARKLVLRIIDKAGSEEVDINTMDHTRIRRRKRRVLVTSFTLLAAIAMGWWLFPKQQLGRTAGAATPEALVVNKGSRSHYLLPDGTTVWLNAGSKLFYENDFKGSTRVVRLEGEAFFDVKKDTKRPFIVRASEIDIKVLGTAFNVKSYPEDVNVETTLYRGLVNVVRHNAKDDTTIELKPNEKLVLSKQAAIAAEKLSSRTATPAKTSAADFTITMIDSTKKESERIETAWVHNRLAFQRESIAELALKMERWYNVRIVITDEKIKDDKVTGSFEKETIEQALAALKEGFSINYKINGDEILISPPRE